MNPHKGKLDSGGTNPLNKEFLSSYQTWPESLKADPGIAPHHDAKTRYGFGKDTNKFYTKIESLDTIRHNTWTILKYPSTIGPTFPILGHHSCVMPLKF